MTTFNLPLCGADPCPVILSSACVFYQGQNLTYIGINTNDSLQTIIEKINQAFQNSGIGYGFENGITQPTQFDNVQLGGSLTKNTLIEGNYTLKFVGTLESSKHVTTGGSVNEFVKGDGSLDNTIYQPSGNYITSLFGDGVASGPGSSNFTLNSVNSNPGTHGSPSTIPIISVNEKGLVTNVSTTSFSIPNQPLLFTGNVVGSGFTGSEVVLSLQNVNTDVYLTQTFLKFSVNEKGLVTSAEPITNVDLINLLGYIPVPNSRTLTINGITHDLSNNRTWEIPTLTDINLTTFGNNGIATWDENSQTLNIPAYSINGLGGVPSSRTITINGVSLDLSLNRSFTVGDLRSDLVYANPSWISSISWSKITNLPTTLVGYGITDAYTKSQTDLKFVPYQGASFDVDLGQYGMKLNDLSFSTTPLASPNQEGVVNWDVTDSTLSLIVKPDIDLKIGQDILSIVTNNTASILNKGSVVYATGANQTSERLSVDLFLADSVSTSFRILGVLVEDIPINGQGYCKALGKIEGIDLSTFSEGDEVWASPSVPGGITNVKPSLPNATVFVGYAVVPVTDGVLYVNIQYSPDSAVNAALEAATEAENAATLSTEQAVLSASARDAAIAAQLAAENSEDNAATSEANALLSAQAAAASELDAEAARDEIVNKIDFTGAQEGDLYRVNNAGVAVRINETEFLRSKMPFGKSYLIGSLFDPNSHRISDNFDRPNTERFNNPQGFIYEDFIGTSEIRTSNLNRRLYTSGIFTFNTSGIFPFASPSLFNGFNLNLKFRLEGGAVSVFYISDINNYYELRLAANNISVFSWINGVSTQLASYAYVNNIISNWGNCNAYIYNTQNNIVISVNYGQSVNIPTNQLPGGVLFNGIGVSGSYPLNKIGFGGEIQGFYLETCNRP